MLTKDKKKRTLWLFLYENNSFSFVLVYRSLLKRFTKTKNTQRFESASNGFMKLISTMDIPFCKGTLINCANFFVNIYIFMRQLKRNLSLKGCKGVY